MSLSNWFVPGCHHAMMYPEYKYAYMTSSVYYPEYMQLVRKKTILSWFHGITMSRGVSKPRPFSTRLQRSNCI